jgi:hypothetical protein
LLEDKTIATEETEEDSEVTEEEGDEVVMTEEEMTDQKDVSIAVKKVTSPEIAPSV